MIRNYENYDDDGDGDENDDDDNIDDDNFCKREKAICSLWLNLKWKLFLPELHPRSWLVSFHF